MHHTVKGLRKKILTEAKSHRSMKKVEKTYTRVLVERS